jgi:hypothetical protein
MIGLPSVPACGIGCLPGLENCSDTSVQVL